MFPIDAAVIPLPSEETTPPVTKTYFDIDDLQGGFSNVTGESRQLNLWLGLGVFELVPEVAEVADAYVVDLDEVDGVAPVLGAFVRVMKGRDADHAHAGDLIFARPADLVGAITHHLGVVVVLVLVADGDDLGVHPGELQPDRRRGRGGDHRP